MPRQNRLGAGVKRLALLLAAVLAFGAQSGLSAPLDAAALARARVYSAACRGQSLLVLKGGRTLLEDYPNGASADDAHKIYSGTKAYWGLAALAAAAEGRLSLDERVSVTLPEWQSDPRRAQVTVRQLLDFSAGLEPGFFLHANSMSDRNRLALALPMIAGPGQRFLYGPAPLQVFHEVLRRKLAPRRETPTRYLERRVLAPLGMGSQRYLADRKGNPLLATGWQLTACEWAKIGRVALAGGAPVLRPGGLKPALRGSAANPAFSLGWWNNRAASGGREFDIEDMLERDWQREDWRGTVVCRDAPSDLLACIGSGYQRLYVIPSMSLIVVRQGAGGRFSDGRFLRLLLGK